jgi:hypothetical protein
MYIYYEQFLHNSHLVGSAIYLKKQYYPRNLINTDFPLQRKSILMIHVDPTDECDKKGVFCLKIKHCESGNRTQMSKIISALKSKNHQTGNIFWGSCRGVKKLHTV